MNQELTSTQMPQATEADLDSFVPSDDFSSAESHQYLTFQLLDEKYAVEILRVQEIRNFSHITPIPNAPKHVKGAMNLRGTVVPIVDLRAKFNLASVEYDEYTVIIVVSIGEKVVGLVVDAVNEVLDISEDTCEPPPDLAGEVDSSFIAGLAKQKGKLVTILNIDKLVGRDAPVSDTDE